MTIQRRGGRMVVRVREMMIRVTRVMKLVRVSRMNRMKTRRKKLVRVRRMLREAIRREKVMRVSGNSSTPLLILWTMKLANVAGLSLLRLLLVIYRCRVLRIVHLHSMVLHAHLVVYFGVRQQEMP
jgi:hypothetical protein